MTSPQAIPAPSGLGLVLALIPLLLCMAILAWRGLGQVRALAIATSRMLVQITALGFVLGAVFAFDRPWLVLLLGFFMLLAAAHAIGSRQTRASTSVWLESLLAMGMSVSLVMLLSTQVVLRVTPWYSPQTIIPLLGMILGNSVNGMALASDRLDAELRQQREVVELRLALGATSRQAALPALQSAVRAGLTPTINGMTIAGIVAIPGMATGQLLAGADVATALRYQVLLYLAIAGTVGPGMLLLLLMRFRHYFTPAHQLRRSTLDDPVSRA